jgi:hypothetical protein
MGKRTAANKGARLRRDARALRKSLHSRPHGYRLSASRRFYPRGYSRKANASGKALPMALWLERKQDDFPLRNHFRPVQFRPGGRSHEPSEIKMITP